MLGHFIDVRSLSAGCAISTVPEALAATVGRSGGGHVTCHHGTVTVTLGLPMFSSLRVASQMVHPVGIHVVWYCALQ